MLCQRSHHENNRNAVVPFPLLTGISYAVMFKSSGLCMLTRRLSAPLAPQPPWWQVLKFCTGMEARTLVLYSKSQLVREIPTA